MLEEDDQSLKHDSDGALCQSSSTTYENGASVSSSVVSTRETSINSDGVLRRDSSIEEASHASDDQTVSSKAASDDLLDGDPWLPVSVKLHSPIRCSTRYCFASGKIQSNSHLRCCNGASSAAAVAFAAECDSRSFDYERFANSSNLSCQSDENQLHKLAETRTTDADEVPTLDADLRHGLTEIKEGMPVSCYDMHRTGTSHISYTHCGHDFSSIDHVPKTGAEYVSDASRTSHLPIVGLRPVRKASLNGLRKAVRSVLVHRNSLPSQSSAGLDDGAPSESSASAFSDNSSVSSLTEKFSRSAGSKRLSKIDRRSYFGGGGGAGCRGQRGGGSIAVDSVRQGLTNLLRGANHGSSVVGERMAAACLERPASSTLTLAGRSSGRILSGDFDDVEAAEICRLRPEQSPTLSGDGDQSDNEFEGLSTTHLCELDAGSGDSFYESRLFDALETPEKNDDDDGTVDTDSSDDGTYSAESFSDLAPSQPASTPASSRGSVEVDCPAANDAKPRQSDLAETCNSGQSAADSVVSEDTVHRRTRQQFDSNVKCRSGLIGGVRCSLSSLQQFRRVNDISDRALTSRMHWKRLSL